MHLLHLLVDLIEHLVAHHVHHGVDSAGVLLLRCWLHHLLWLHRHRLHGLHVIELWLQHIDVVRIVHVVHHVVDLGFGNATRLKELTALVEVESHLLELLQELLFLVNEVGWDH